MKYKKTIYTLVLMGVSLTMPVLASANGVQYSEENRNEPSSFILKVQQRPDLGGKGIFSYDSELSREPKLFRESPDKSSDTEKSYSDSLGPSFDMPKSIDGHVQRQGPSSGDPSVRDLSGMGGGFSPPGAYTGSERRP
jgi:hypothetical protein